MTVRQEIRLEPERPSARRTITGSELSNFRLWSRTTKIRINMNQQLFNSYFWKLLKMFPLALTCAAKDAALPSHGWLPPVFPRRNARRLVLPPSSLEPQPRSHGVTEFRAHMNKRSGHIMLKFWRDVGTRALWELSKHIHIARSCSKLLEVLKPSWTCLLYTHSWLVSAGFTMTTAQSHLSTKASRASLAFAPGVKDRSQSSEPVDQVDQVDQVHGWNILECHTGYAMLYPAIPSCFCSANADLFFQVWYVDSRSSDSWNGRHKSYETSRVLVACQVIGKSGEENACRCHLWCSWVPCNQCLLEKIRQGRQIAASRFSH